MRNLSGPDPAATHEHRSQAPGPSSTLHTGDGGGFALHEALLRRVAGVSHPLVVQFPPIGDGAAAT